MLLLLLLLVACETQDEVKNDERVQLQTFLDEETEENRMINVDDLAHFTCGEVSTRLYYYGKDLAKSLVTSDCDAAVQKIINNLDPDKIVIKYIYDGSTHRFSIIDPLTLDSFYLDDENEQITLKFNENGLRWEELILTKDDVDYNEVKDLFEEKFN